MKLPNPRQHLCPESSTRRRFAWWPVSLEFVLDKYTVLSWFTWHGWEIKADEVGQVVYGWTFHVGPLKVYFGERDA
jgi:hypothetical protein